jgi:hypothetical protein
MEQLAKAAAAIEAGNMSEAHVLLAQAIKANPNDVDAWLLLSQTAGSAEQKKTFLKRALIVDPDNETARQRLADLETMSGAAPAETAVEQAPPAEAASAEEEGPAVPADEAVAEVPVVEEPPTPPSHNLADTVIVGAPEATLVLPTPTPAEVMAEPDATTPVEAFVDPFDFDSQEEQVPGWLLGEVVAAEAVAETSIERAPEPAGEIITLVEEGAATAATPAKEEIAPAEMPPAAAAATTRAVADSGTGKPAGSSTAWLEWVIVALVLLLFLTVIFLLAA